MSTEYIKDRTGKVIGTLRKEFNGDLTMMNEGGRVLGRYNSNHKKTYDWTGRPIGTDPGLLYSLLR